MSSALERFVLVNGSRCRVLQKGSGRPVLVLSGHGGLPRWDRFHELLSLKRRVIAPALPGQFGSDAGHELLHTPLDWLAMIQDLIEAAAPLEVVDIVATSVAGMLACEVASAVPECFERMVLVGSYGLHDETNPTVNLSEVPPTDRPKMLARNVSAYEAVFMPPPGADNAERAEFFRLTHRSHEAIARLAGPHGDLNLQRRLHRIRNPTLLIWGEQDQLVPVSYARRFADGLRGFPRVEIVQDAGHLATIDAPDTVASLVLSFIDERVRLSCE